MARNLMSLGRMIRRRFRGVNVRVRPKLEDEVCGVNEEQNDRRAARDGEDGSIGFTLILLAGSSQVERAAERCGDDDGEDRDGQQGDVELCRANAVALFVEAESSGEEAHA